MHVLNLKSFAFLFLAAALLSGCASVPMAGLDQDAAAKTYQVRQGKANIYVYRNENLGSAVKLTLLLDGRLVGDTAAKTYFLLEVDPGRHTLLSKAENDSVLELVAEAGRNYFVWQEVKMGMWQPRSLLQQVDEAAGRVGVEACALALHSQ